MTDEEEWLKRKQEWHERNVAAFLERQRKQQEDEERVRRIANEIGSTVSAVRAAEAEVQERRRRARRLQELEKARRHLGLTAAQPETRLERYARKLLEIREPDGTWPPQTTLAEALGVTDRAVRQVGWRAILEFADQLAAASSAGSSG